MRTYEGRGSVPVLGGFFRNRPGTSRSPGAFFTKLKRRGDRCTNGEKLVFLGDWAARSLPSRKGSSDGSY
jgi:hypothetical protein